MLQGVAVGGLLRVLSLRILCQEGVGKIEHDAKRYNTDLTNF
ncbi:hypothetical protein C8R11_11222 [Nitrosomonas aestuarii]|nr:hypothetical protein C8R11_11222 [Nitrosomonas aestuarii]